MMGIDELFETRGVSEEIRNPADLQTRREVDHIAQKRDNAEVRWEQINANLDAELREVQSRCSHRSTTFYPDAYDDNESDTLCNICEARIR